MKLNRRSFLRLAGAASLAAVAPAFIPSDRLEMGVPRAIARPDVPTIWSPETTRAAVGGEPLEWLQAYADAVLANTLHPGQIDNWGVPLTTELLDERGVTHQVTINTHDYTAIRIEPEPIACRWLCPFNNPHTRTALERVGYDLHQAHRMYHESS